MKNTPRLLNRFQDKFPEAGCDEAGRGPVAGPLFAAAVILPEHFHHPLLNDSKQMTPSHRETLREIIQKEAISWAVEQVDVEEIDRINILGASIVGMQRAALRLSPTPAFVIVDGNRFKPFSIPFRTIVHGDALYASIAAASVLAKTYRDDFMREIAKDFPEYGWDKNFGYPTSAHIEAIRNNGYTPWHRTSFTIKELEPTIFDAP